MLRRTQIRSESCRLPSCARALARRIGRAASCGLALVLATGCASSPASPIVRVAHLDTGAADEAGLAAIRGAFRDANPGYDLFACETRSHIARTTTVLFVQSGEGEAHVKDPLADDDGTEHASETSSLAVGDIVLLRPGQALHVDRTFGFVGFELPSPLASDLPSFVRPDWDPNITDTPGGCATETGAYRRILLTWLETNGAYVSHELNAHRVRITDSFTHYHPKDGGFDEFYLVQMVQPGARLLTSERTAAVVARDVSADEVDELFDVHELRVGDLVHLPRGTIHRGLGGALVQVIAVPGFVPGTEIGVDDDLRAINAALGRTGDAALPTHE